MTIARKAKQTGLLVVILATTVCVSFYLTLSLVLPVILALYISWWTWTIPSYYGSLETKKDDLWASKTTRALLLAVPGLALFMMLPVSALYLILDLFLGFDSTLLGMLCPYMLALPFVTGGIMLYSTVALGDMVD